MFLSFFFPLIKNVGCTLMVQLLDGVGAFLCVHSPPFYYASFSYTTYLRTAFNFLIFSFTF